MKITCWLSARLMAFAGAVLVCGCITPGAPPMQGLTAQPLVNVAQPAAKSSWLPKLPFTNPSVAKSKAKAEPARTATMQDSQPLESATAKGEKKKIDYVALGRLNERRGQSDMAKQLYGRELELNPKNGLVHHRLAVMAAKDEDWNQANEHFQIAQKLLPDNAELLSDLGYALYLQHRLDDAEAALRNAVAVNPRNHSAHNNLGIVLGVQGKYEESFTEFKHAGSTANAHANLAYAQAQLGDIDLAMANLNRALSLDPNLKAATIELIQLNDLKKRFDVAPQATEALVKDEQLPGKKADAQALANVLEIQKEKGRQVDQLAARAAQAEVREDRVQPNTKQPLADEQPALAEKRSDVNELIDSVVDAPRRTVAKPAVDIEYPGQVAAASAAVARPPLPVAAVRPANQPMSAAIESPYRRPTFDTPLPKTEAAPAVAVTPAVAAPSSTAASDASPAAHPPQVAFMPRPQAHVLPASASISASNSSSRRRVQKPTAEESSVAAVSPTGLAPVISPSMRMQEIQSGVRKEAEATWLKDQSKPSIKLAPVAKPIEATVTRAQQGNSPSGELLSVAESSASTAAASFPQIVPPGSERSASNMDFSARMPSIPMPRPEDLMPKDALLQQLPTSHLHPAAQSTWSSSTQPLRYLTDQKGLDTAHFFKGPAAPAEGAMAGKPLAAGFAPQVADQSQFEALQLPMKY